MDPALVYASYTLGKVKIICDASLSWNPWLVKINDELVARVPSYRAAVEAAGEELIVQLDRNRDWRDKEMNDATD